MKTSILLTYALPMLSVFHDPSCLILMLLGVVICRARDLDWREECMTYPIAHIGA